MDELLRENIKKLRAEERDLKLDLVEVKESTTRTTKAIKDLLTERARSQTETVIARERAEIEKAFSPEPEPTPEKVVDPIVLDEKVVELPPVVVDKPRESVRKSVRLAINLKPKKVIEPAEVPEKIEPFEVTPKISEEDRLKHFWSQGNTTESRIRIEPKKIIQPEPEPSPIIMKEPRQPNPHLAVREKLSNMRTGEAFKVFISSLETRLQKKLAKAKEMREQIPALPESEIQKINFQIKSIRETIRNGELKELRYREEVQPLEERITKLKEEIASAEGKTAKFPEEGPALMDSLSDAEKNTLKKEMGEDIPMDFESAAAKFDPRVFLANQIVKAFSGLDISSGMKKIIRKLRRKALLGIGIITIWSSNTSLIIPENSVKGKISTISKKEIKAKTNIKVAERKMDMSTYEQLSQSAKEIYLYSITNIDSSYIIVDKPRAAMYVIGKDKKLIATFPVILGKSKGEEMNISDLNTLHPGPGATTPAGRYNIGHDSILTSDSTEFKGKILSIYNVPSIGGEPSIHITYPKELKKRTIALNTPGVENKRMSWGCINLDEKNWDKYIAGNISEGAILFILPDNPNIRLNLQTGKLESH